MSSIRAHRALPVGRTSETVRFELGDDEYVEYEVARDAVLVETLYDDGYVLVEIVNPDGETVLTVYDPTSWVSLELLDDELERRDEILANKGEDPDADPVGAVRPSPEPSDDDSCGHPECDELNDSLERMLADLFPGVPVQIVRA